MRRLRYLCSSAASAGQWEETAVWHANVPVSRAKPVNSNPLGLDSGTTAKNLQVTSGSTRNQLGIN